MSNGFPCPNPACPHVFSPGSVKGAAAVDCPRCGTVFRFRNSAAPRQPSPFPPPSLPTPAVPPPPPPSRPAPPPVPPPILVPSIGARSVASGLAFDEPSPAPSAWSRKKRRRGNGGKYAAAFVFLLLIGGAVGAFVYFRDSIPWGEADRRGGKTKGNFSITLPPEWKNDEALLTKFRANVARTRARPRGHFVLRYRDYERRLPGDVEMFDDAVKRLEAYFPKFEYVDPFGQDNRGRDSVLDGEPALVFTFSAADASQVPLRGECHMVARQGFGYWLIFWGPEEFQETLAGQFAAIRERFKFHDDRDGWKPRPREAEVVRGATVGFQAKAAKEVWKNETNAKGADPAAELLLRGFDPIEDEETGRTRVVPLAGNAAEILVFFLAPQPDLPSAVKAGKRHILGRVADANPDAKFEPIADEKGGAGNTVGEFPGRVERLRLVLGPDSEKFALVGVARRPDGVLVVLGECNWDRRGYWEQEFKAFLETVRPAPKGPRAP